MAAKFLDNFDMFFLFFAPEHIMAFELRNSSF